MDTQTQIDRLIELAIIQRSELKQLVEQLPQLREHLNSEVEKVFDETEPQLRAELEEWTTKQTADKTAALGVALEAKIADLAKSLEVSTQARYNAIIAEREENARLAAQAEAKIAEHAASLPGAVKEIVTAELARFPRAGEIDQLRKEFAEPRGLNPRGKWQAGVAYNKLDLVTINGDSYTSATDNNRTRPTRSSADWTLVAARGTGGGGGPTSLSELTTVPSNGDLLIGSGTSWVTSNLTAGAGISITVGAGEITISATDGDITLDDGTAASPSLHFTNDPDTGIYRPAANTLGISVSGTQVAYFDENGLTVPSAGVVAGGSFHGANGNANNPSLSFTGDQDTGFFRHQPNEIGVALGGTQYATLTSTTFSVTPALSVAGVSRVTNSTASSSTTTGALVVTGGVGVGGAANVGGNLTVSGGTIGTAASTNLTLQGGSSGASLVLGQGTNANATFNPTGLGYFSHVGAGSNGPVYRFTRSTASAGLGAVVGVFEGYQDTTRVAQFGIYSDGATDSGRYDFWVKATGGSLTQAMILKSNGNLLLGTTIDGGQKLQVAGTATVSGNTTLTSTTASTSTSTGALVVSGGVGIAKELFAGGTITTSANSSQQQLVLNGTSNQGTTVEIKNTGTGGNNWAVGTNFAVGAGEFSVYDRTAGYHSFKITPTSSGAATLYPTGGLVVENGPIKTAAPTGGTAKEWKLGEVATVSPTSPNRTLRVMVDGNVYYIAAKTTND